MPPGSAPEVIDFLAGDGMKLNLIYYPPLCQPRRIAEQAGRHALVEAIPSQMPVQGINAAALADETCALILGERR
jgi:hypothetical protein